MTRGAGVYLQILPPVGSHECNSVQTCPGKSVTDFFYRKVCLLTTYLMLWLLPTLENNTRQGAVAPNLSTLHGGLLAFTLAHFSFSASSKS